MTSHAGHSRAGFLGLSAPRGIFAQAVRNIMPAVRTASQGYAAKWQENASIREEFGTFEAYVASKTAKAKR